MLINEDAISQAEHTALCLSKRQPMPLSSAAPPTARMATSTNLVLPGGISVNFSGHDVRHADGRQLQRLGIQPHIKVEPTITGTREGRDEVLGEAALKFLDSTVKR